MQLSRRHAAAGLIALGGAAAPWSVALSQTLPETPTLAAVPPDETPTRVDTARDGYERMLAPVTINGQGPFQFLIDTGANASCISRVLATRLMLASTEPARVHTVVGVRERPGVMIDRLQVGARSRKRVRVAALPLTSEIDGVLGVDWLDGQRLEIGFKDKSLAITGSKADIAKDGLVAVVPARRRWGQLTIVDADLSGKRINAIIDSGSQMTLCNAALRDLVAASNARHSGKDAQLVTMETVAGEAFSGELIYLPFLRLGDLQMGNVPVVFAEMHVFDVWGLKTKPAVVLGMDLLTQFDTVALDFGRSHVRFDIAQSPVQPTPAAQPV
jgi:predicted aspartyl protease